MKPLFDDTDPKVEQFVIEGIRKRDAAQRFEMASSLTATCVNLAFRAIRRARPEMSYRDAELFFVEMNYGPDLARAIRKRLCEKNQ